MCHPDHNLEPAASIGIARLIDEKVITRVKQLVLEAMVWRALVLDVDAFRRPIVIDQRPPESVVVVLIHCIPWNTYVSICRTNVKEEIFTKMHRDLECTHIEIVRIWTIASMAELQAVEVCHGTTTILATPKFASERTCYSTDHEHAISKACFDIPRH